MSETITLLPLMNKNNIAGVRVQHHSTIHSSIYGGFVEPAAIPPYFTKKNKKGGGKKYK